MQNDVDVEPALFEQLSTCEFYDLKSASNKFGQTKNDFSCILWNAASVRNKFDDFEAFLECLNLDFSIIALNETWLRSDDPDSFFKLKNYNQHVCNRKNRIGGGVALYVNCKYEYSLRHDSPFSEHFESVLIELKANDIDVKPILICVLYRPPDPANFEHFVTQLDSLFSLAAQERKKLIVLGDLNLDTLTTSPSVNTRRYLDLTLSYSFKIHTTKATRASEHSATNIDHILSNISKECHT